MTSANLFLSCSMAVCFEPGLIDSVQADSVTTEQSTASKKSQGTDPKPQAKRLGMVTVKGQEGYMADAGTSATKTDTSLLETPQSVSVVTRQQMNDMGVQNLDDALLYTPGVFTGLVGAATRFDYTALRGFTDGSTDNTVLDGLKVLSDSGSYSSMQVDPYFLQQVEVLRGPASVLYGRASPGGLIAMSSKQPTLTPYHEAEAGFGTQGTKRVGLDFAGPLSKDGRISYRIASIYHYTDTQTRDVRSDRYAIMPSIRLQFTSDTVLSLQAYLQNDPNGGWHSGVPADASINANHNDRRISRHFFDGEPDRDQFYRRQRMFSYSFEHHFNDQWSVRQNFRYLHSTVDLKQVYDYGWVDSDSDYLNRYYSGAREKLDAYAVDNQLLGHVDTGPIRHTLLFGIDYQNRHNDTRNDSGTNAPLNAFDPVYGNDEFIGDLRSTWARRHLSQLGFYLQDQLAYQHWRLLLGVRHDHVDAKNTTLHTGAVSQMSQGKLTKRAGLVYLFDNGLSPYFSYGESFNPNALTDVNGQLLKSMQSKQKELGIKYQPPGSHTLLTLAAYNLRQDNVGARVLNTAYYEAVGSVRSRGIEFEAKTQLTERLSLIGSYTFTRMKYLNGDNRGRTPYQAPRHMASIWSQYRMPSGFRAGMGVRYTSTSWADNEDTVKVPTYTLVDASLGYDFGRMNSRLAGLDFQLDIRNLFNKAYIASCAGTNWCYFGAERSIMGTLRYQF